MTEYPFEVVTRTDTGPMKHGRITFEKREGFKTLEAAESFSCNSRPGSVVEEKKWISTIA